MKKNNYDNERYEDDLIDPVPKKKKKKSKKKKKFPLWAKILIGIFITVLLAIGTIAFLVDRQLDKINRPPEEIETVAPEDEYFETDPPPTVITTTSPDGSTSVPTQKVEEVPPSSINWPEDIEPYYDKDVINILLIGQDRRPGEKRARSDSMIILTIDKKTKSLKMTSLLRDLYVQIPGYSDNRINASYAWGGMKLLDKTIEKNFGIKIDRNIEVDFTAFKKVIDNIGGVTITLTEKEASHLRNQGFSVGATSTLMNGDLALAYSRIRYIDSDFYRTNRQRKVLEAVFNKMKNRSLSEWYSLTNEIFPLLTTDMTNSEIINHVYTVYNMKVNKINSYRVPADNTYKSRYVRKMAVLVPDLQANRKYLLNNIYGR